MHHAGMVPAFREIVEACFERNLLGRRLRHRDLGARRQHARAIGRAREVLEVLRRGTQVPHQRRVLPDDGPRGTSRPRRRRSRHRLLRHRGRPAGRGDASPWRRPRTCTPLFDPTYNFTANLINHFDFETALEVVQRSYAQFETDHRPSGTKRPLGDQMVARHHVLEELGYADGWRLNSPGSTPCARSTTSAIC